MIWTMRKALFVLVGSSSFTLCAFMICYFFWASHKKEKWKDPQYCISWVIQTGPEKGALSTEYLTEILDLSVDAPTHLWRFDLREGEKKLLSSPLIAEAHIQKKSPDTLYIDYTVRQPIAKLVDYPNIAVDQNGYLFPIAPFLQSKELPEIYLGLPPFLGEKDSFGRSGGAWNTPLKNRYFDLACDLLAFLETAAKQEGFKIKRIDVSNAFALTLGKREIVLYTEEEMAISPSEKCIFPKILRLSQSYHEQMTHFFALRKSMLEDYRRQIAHAAIPASGLFSPRIIDLRLAHLAFIEN